MFTVKNFPGGYSYRVFEQKNESEADKLNVPLTTLLKKFPKHIIQDIAALSKTRIEHNPDLLTITGRAPEQFSLAKSILENIPDNFGKVDYTHFISIPLGMKDEVEAFHERAKCLNPDLPVDALISAQKFHLTVCMLRLEGEDDVKRVVDTLQGIEAVVKSKLQLIIQGTGIMKGTTTDCRVLYAKVKSNSQLSDLGRFIQSHLAARGLIHDFRPVNWHATLINTRHCTEPDSTFDATAIIDSHKSTEFGRPIVKELHLSSLSKPPNADSGYYHCEYSWKLKKQAIIS